jgi:hypothetical protein
VQELFAEEALETYRPFCRIVSAALGESLQDRSPLAAAVLGMQQRPLVELLKAEGCDYLFQIKANQPDVLDALKVCFADALQSKPAHEVAEKRGSITKPGGCGSTWTTPSMSASV